MIDRERALALLRGNVKNENMIKHSLASEAVMRALARELGEDEDKWGIAGLLHDVDVEITNADLAVHTKMAVDILKSEGVDEEIIEAVRLHNETAHPGERRATRFQHALAAGETVTGLVTAAALVLPDKKLSSVNPKSVERRMKEKAFARSVNRDHILECEKIGIDLPKFILLSVEAMRSISADLGL